MWTQILQKIVKWIDPKLEKYRAERKKPEPYTPKTLTEFIDVVARTPMSVLDKKDRARIAAVMSFDERAVGELMTPKKEMVFVKANEVLGPLTLDDLYKSGFTEFPVMDSKGKVIGILHTEALNALEIREAEKAEKYMDPNVHYLSAFDSLKTAVDEMMQTGSEYFLVRDEEGETVGFFNLRGLLTYLLG